MKDKTSMIKEKEALCQIQFALRRAALIYHYFAQTLLDELGQTKGRELIAKAVNAYGEHIGKAARTKAEKADLPLRPEHYQDDLPMMAWNTESVVVDGEERVRVHHCPLAKEWQELGDTRTARLYCFVDQSKMTAFNPEFEYIHINNILDGDPYCELVVRPVSKKI